MKCNIDMSCVWKFSKKIIDKLVQFNNSVPNIPVALYDRIPHGRNDGLFTFSHRIHGVQALIGSDGLKGYELSPEFADQFSKSKCSLRVYFRGVREEDRDKYVSCFLRRTTEASANEEHRTFGRQLFMDLGNISDESKPKVYSHSVVENTLKYSDGKAWGVFAPSSAFSGRTQLRSGSLFTLNRMTLFEQSEGISI